MIHKTKSFGGPGQEKDRERERESDQWVELGIRKSINTSKEETALVMAPMLCVMGIYRFACKEERYGQLHRSIKLDQVESRPR